MKESEIKKYQNNSIMALASVNHPEGTKKNIES